MRKIIVLSLLLLSVPLSAATPRLATASSYISFGIIGPGYHMGYGHHYGYRPYGGYRTYRGHRGHYGGYHGGRSHFGHRSYSRHRGHRGRRSGHGLGGYNGFGARHGRGY